METSVWSRLRPRFGWLDMHRALMLDMAARHDNVERLAAYFRVREDDADCDVIDDRTWADLDMDDVFRAVDFARSEPGRQVLHATLRSPQLTPGTLAHLDRSVDAVQGSSALRERIQKAVGKLADRRAAWLVELFYGELPERPAFWWCFPMLTLIALVSLGAVWFWPRAIAILVGLSVVNLVVQVVLKPRMERFIPAIHELPAFLTAAEALGELNHPELERETAVLRRASEQRSLRRAARWLMFEPTQSNDLTAAFYGYVNLLLLLDVNAFVFATERIRREQPALQALFGAFGQLDVVQSVATWREQLPRWSRPVFHAQAKRLSATELVHPLLDEAVPNAIAIDGTSVLVTGSNMSGKTTSSAHSASTRCSRRRCIPCVPVSGVRPSCGCERPSAARTTCCKGRATISRRPSRSSRSSRRRRRAGSASSCWTRSFAGPTRQSESRPRMRC